MPLHWLFWVFGSLLGEWIMLNYSEIANQSDCLKRQDHWLSLYYNNYCVWHHDYANVFACFVGKETGLQFSRQFIAALTETTFKQCGMLRQLKFNNLLCTSTGFTGLKLGICEHFSGFYDAGYQYYYIRSIMKKAGIGLFVLQIVWKITYELLHSHWKTRKI